LKFAIANIRQIMAKRKRGVGFTLRGKGKKTAKAKYAKRKRVGKERKRFVRTKS